MHVQPYLNFDGRCEEALDFYKQAIGAKVGMLLRFKDAPDPSMMYARQREQGHAFGGAGGRLDRADVGRPLQRQARISAALR